MADNQARRVINMLHPPQPQTDHEAILEIYQVVIGLQGKMTEICEHCKAEDARVGKLEDWQSRMGAVLGVVAAVASIVGAAVASTIGRLLQP